MTFAQATPSGAYTVVLGLAMPAESGGGKIFTLGNALRVELRRSTGGVYINVFHTGVAAATSYVIGTTAPNSEMWTLVLRYTGTVLHQYVLNGAGVAETTNTDTIGFAGAQSEILLGDTFAVDGLYAAVVIPSDVGNTEAVALRDNMWRAFAPESGGSPTCEIAATTANVVGSLASSVSPASSVNVTTADITAAWSSVSAPSAAIAATTANTVGSLASTGSAASGTFTSEVLRDNTGTIVASKALNHVALYNDTTGDLVVRKTGLSTNGSGVFTFTDVTLTAGVTYRIDWEDIDGRRRMPRKAAT